MKAPLISNSLKELKDCDLEKTCIHLRTGPPSAMCQSAAIGLFQRFALFTVNKMWQGQEKSSKTLLSVGVL